MLFISSSRLEENLPDAIDGIELRLDLFSHIDFSSLSNFLRYAKKRVLFTARRSEGLIERLLALQPPFFDLEGNTRPDFLHRVISQYPRTQFILSYHNFEETPKDLEAIYQQLSSYPAYAFKIATQANSTSDALRLLLFGRKHPRLSVIPMGERGAFGRVLGPIVGNLIDYTYLDAPVAPGQLSVQELVDIYRYPTLNAQTALYGLIGDPVASSQGHLYHNRVFAERDLNAVYVKMRVEERELPAFFPLAQELGFRGLSVTMPLKEKVLPSQGAINTLLLKNGQLFGANTDGAGALDALEKRGPVRGKTIVLLGAGGAARAIALEAKARGAHIAILNRTLQKAQRLACAVGGSSELPAHYDCLINCSAEPLPIKPLPNALVMDIVYVPRETPFLQQAKELGCEVIYGEEMFFNQAAKQTEFWL